jgi:uncharacterized membrane protein
MLILNKVLLMLHFIGLAMGLAVPFANIALATLMAKAAPNEKMVLGRFPFAMSKVGKIGLTLLWVTGVTMVFTRWRGFGNLPPMFHAKLTAVILLTITIGIISMLEMKAKKGDTTAIARIQVVGKIAMALGILAVVFAVLTFN